MRLGVTRKVTCTLGLGVVLVYCAGVGETAWGATEAVGSVVPYILKVNKLKMGTNGRTD